MSRAGVFIVFEGGEGVGKSTQVAMTAEWLRSLGREVLVTREPGGTLISERIREVLLDEASSGMDPRTEALLYAAARAQHAVEVIRPALGSGSVVLCDRYIGSSVAYQGGARGLGRDRIRELSLWATNELLPDRTILLTMGTADGLERKGEAKDRLEKEPLDFHDAVAVAYLEEARTDASWSVIDAVGNVDDVQTKVREALTPLFGGGGS